MLPTETELTATLAAAVPVHLHPQIPACAQLLLHLVDDNRGFMIETLQRRATTDTPLAILLRALSGKSLVIGQVVLTFTSENNAVTIHAGTLTAPPAPVLHPSSTSESLATETRYDQRQGVFLTENASAAGLIIGVNWAPITIHLPPPHRAPPTERRLPTVTRFIGRETELTLYIRQFQTQRSVIITGLPGIGKTQLAAVLARRLAPLSMICWCDLTTASFDAVLEQLAIFLAQQGQREVWDFRHQQQFYPSQSRNWDLQMDYLIQHMEGHDYVVCIDDVHRLPVDEHPYLDALLTRLHHALEKGQGGLIITSRQRLSFLPTILPTTLVGLNLADVRQFLYTNDVHLSDDLIDQLYTHTEGHLHILVLAMNLLKTTDHPYVLITHLAKMHHIEGYLKRHVYQHLTPQEHAVMEALAVLLDEPGTLEVVEAMLEQTGLWTTLTDLADRYLVDAYEIIREDSFTKEYKLHATLQTFFYEHGKSPQSLHLRAGEYYATTDRELLKAAVHFEHAKDYPRAVYAATTDMWSIVNRGYGQKLKDLLEQLIQHPLDSSHWLEVLMTQGDIYSILGETQHAYACYRHAWEYLSTLPSSPLIHEQQAQICRNMGSLRHIDPHEAIQWLQHGLAIIKDLSTREQARISISLGSVLIQVGKYQAAQQTLEASLRCFAIDTDPLRGQTLQNLGNIALYQGDFYQARHYYLTVQAIFERHRMHWRLIDITLNQGLVEETLGDWGTAMQAYLSVVKQSEQLGSKHTQGLGLLAIGILETKQGLFDEAKSRLTHCIELATQHHLTDIVIGATSSLADLHIRNESWDEVEKLLPRAETHAVAHQNSYQLVEIYAGWAQVWLARHDAECALTHVTQSIQLARDLGMQREEGMGLRILGQIQVAQQHTTQALETFDQSLTLLKNLDPYEAARTRMQWGAWLVANKPDDEGITLLQDARATFTRLGAAHDLVLVQKLLGDM